MQDSDSNENEMVDNKDIDEKIVDNKVRDEKVVDNKDKDEKEVPEISKLLGKRKSPPSSPTALPIKVLVLSLDSSETPNHTIADKTTSENDIQKPQATTHHENVKIIPLTEISSWCPLSVMCIFVF